MELSNKSRVILEAIAEGHSYGQILSGDPALTYNDIFRAAAEVLELLDQPATGKTYEQRMVEIRQTHPRAYDIWSDQEDAHLAEFFRKAIAVKEIAKNLQRQPSAIRSRLAKLNLVVSGGDSPVR